MPTPSAGSSTTTGRSTPGSATGPGGSVPEVGGLAVGTEVRPGGPLVLLYSADLDQTLASVTSAGGRAVNGPYGFPGGRRFHFRDTSGNELGVWSEV